MVTNKPLRMPFTPIDMDPEAAKLLKNQEQKLYIVAYYNTEYEEYKYAEFTGRYNTYFGIKRILESESVDIRASVVLVELVGLDPLNRNKARRYLMHPDDALSIYDFCHSIEKYFGDNAYSIDEYDTGGTKDTDDRDYDAYDIKLEHSDDPRLVVGNRYEGHKEGLSATLRTKSGEVMEFFAAGGGKQFFTSATMNNDGSIESKEI